ncbi:MAG: FkbM family methyltransferase [Bacteroidales bacterium]|nr:FkbM family methyltransferase [Bacteroidales bacterium]
MKIIRKILYNSLGLKYYLRIISKIYIWLIKLGFFRQSYAELHFLKEIIKEGDVCIDIGANLGYYSYFMCRYVKPNGKVYAVEPVPLFRQIFEKNVHNKFKQSVVLLPYALGESERKIFMGMPVVDGIVHHGMTHVIENQKNKQTSIALTFEVEMKIPDQLFKNLERINFIKCDVEGYEYHIFTNMLQVLNAHKPVIQCELGEQFKEKTFNLMQQLGYEAFILNKQKLTQITKENLLAIKQDVYFFPKK